MDNIKESKEYQLAKDWERAVNDYGFNPKRFCSRYPRKCTPHCSKAFTDWSRSVSWSWRTRHATYDDRNRASHEEAKCIMEYLKVHGKHIPLR